MRQTISLCDDIFRVSPTSPSYLDHDEISSWADETGKTALSNHKSVQVRGIAQTNLSSRTNAISASDTVNMNVDPEHIPYHFVKTTSMVHSFTLDLTVGGVYVINSSPTPSPHICVSELGQHWFRSPVRRQAVTLTKPGLLSIGLLEKEFSGIRIIILLFLLKNMHLNVSSAKMATILSTGWWVNPGVVNIVNRIRHGVSCIPHWDKSE